MSSAPNPPGSPPPGPPPDDAAVGPLLALARTLAFLVAMIAALFFLLLLAIGFIQVAIGGSPVAFFGSAYCLIAAVVNYLAWRELHALEGLAAQRNYGLLKERLVVWIALGLVFFLVVGVVLAIAWVRIDLRSTGAAPAPPPTSPVCLRCGERAVLIPQNGRFYCYRCSAYLW